VVKGHVTTLQAMIERSKQEQLKNVTQTFVARELSRSVHYEDEDDGCMDEGGGGGLVLSSSSFGGGAPGGAPSRGGPRGGGGGGLGPSVGSAAPPKPSGEQKMDTANDETVLEVKGDVNDYTTLPKQLDRSFEAFDEDSALRPTIIKSGDTWNFKSMNGGLLGNPTTSNLGAEEQRVHKNKAFDLLDALSKSGVLPIHQASLHVLLAATHCFDKTLLDTVIQDNINPIEKVERSSLIVASTIQGVPAASLLRPEHVQRVKELSPKLFLTY